MENTACGENCPFVKQGFCKTDSECPHFVQSVWIEGQSGEHRIVKDCSPKRMLMQQQKLENRLEKVQQALEESRNQYNALSGYLKSLIGMSQIVLKQVKHETNMEKTLNECRHMSNTVPELHLLDNHGTHGGERD